MLYSPLTNPYVVALVIPAIFILLGAFAKKLVRAAGWQWSDFHLGIESTLAAISQALVYIFDLAKARAGKDPGVEVRDKLIATAAFLAISFFALFLVLSLHQDWESKPSSRDKLLVLGVAANLIGAGLMFSFILLLKGVF